MTYESLSKATPGKLIKLYRDQIRRTTGAESEMTHSYHAGRFYRGRRGLVGRPHRGECIAVGKDRLIDMIIRLKERQSHRVSEREIARHLRADQTRAKLQCLRRLDSDGDGKYIYECMTCKGQIVSVAGINHWKFCPHCGTKFTAMVLDTDDIRFERHTRRGWVKGPVFEFVIGPDKSAVAIGKGYGARCEHVITTREYDTKDQIRYALRYAQQEARKAGRPFSVRVKPSPVNPFFLK